MPVRLDEAGEQDLVGEGPIDRVREFVEPRLQVGERPHRQHASVLHGDRRGRGQPGSMVTIFLATKTVIAWLSCARAVPGIIGMAAIASADDDCDAQRCFRHEPSSEFAYCGGAE